MGSPEQQDGQVNFIEVEGVHAAQGSFSIYQVNAHRLEDIEAVVVQVRSQGLIFGTPESLGSPIARPYFKHEPIEYEGSEDLSTIVYFAGPCEITKR